jgi:hypothetical protein
MGIIFEDGTGRKSDIRLLNLKERAYAKQLAPVEIIRYK